MLFAPCCNGHEIGDLDNADIIVDMRHRVAVQRYKTFADKVSAVTACIGRTHHTGMPHARNTDIMHEHKLAGRFQRDVDSRRRLPDQGVAVGRLKRRLGAMLKTHVLVAEQFPIRA